MAELIMRGIAPFTFASAQERDKHAATLQFDAEGLFVPGTDYSRAAACIGASIGDTKLTPMVLKALISGSQARDEAAAMEAAADAVEIFAARNGDGFSVFAGPQGKRKHLVWLSEGSTRRIFGLHDQLERISVNGGEWYYTAVPAYEIQRGKNKGKMAPAKPAVVVRVAAGGLGTKIALKGPEADEYATKNKLTPVNNPQKDDDDDSNGDSA